MTTNFIPYDLDKMYRPEDTPVLCRGGFKRLRRQENTSLMRRHMIRSRVSLLCHSNELFALHNRGWTGANTFEAPPGRPNTTDTYIHVTCLLYIPNMSVRGNISYEMSYKNVGFFLFPLPKTASESGSAQTPMRSTQCEVVTLVLRHFDH